MNKLMGFYELKASGLPTVPWKEYTGSERMDPNVLWTVRTAVYSGSDVNLPRAVGIPGDRASEIAGELHRKFGDGGIVIYYPYFEAEKSGTLDVYNGRTVIEAVKDDLWNLVTYGRRDVTVVERDGVLEYDGNRYFLSGGEISEILGYLPEIKRIFGSCLLEGNSVLLEWSYAYDITASKERAADRHLVFYEARTGVWNTITHRE